MYVRIDRYTVNSDTNDVEVFLEVSVPTSTSTFSTKIAESLLNQMAGDGVWNEAHLVECIKTFLVQLSATVVYGRV